MITEYVLKSLPEVEKSSDSFMGAFIYMMRCKGVELEEEEIQLLYEGIRLELIRGEQTYLQADFHGAVHNFCSQKDIPYKERTISSRNFKFDVHNILIEDGPFMLALTSEDYNYFRSYVRGAVPHCVTVTGIDSEGIYIADGCSYPAHDMVFQGKLPFSMILEMREDCQIWTASVDEEVENKKIELGQELLPARERFLRENVELKPGSRLQAGFNFCEYMSSESETLQGTALCRVAENITAYTHIPQLSMIMRLFKREEEFYYTLSKLSRDWKVLVNYFVRASFDFSFKNQDMLIENYRALLMREKEIYDEILSS